MKIARKRVHIFSEKKKLISINVMTYCGKNSHSLDILGLLLSQKGQMLHIVIQAPKLTETVLGSWGTMNEGRAN